MLVVIVVTIVSLVSIACFGSAADDADGFEEALYLVVDSSERGDLALAAGETGSREVSASFEVRLLPCSIEPAEELSFGIFVPRSCTVNSTSGLSSSPEGLTASGTLVVRAERTDLDFRQGPRVLETLATIPIGPLAFGEAQRTESFTFTFPAEDPPEQLSSWRYQIAARVTGCTVSNGSACGNGEEGFRLNVLPDNTPPRTERDRTFTADAGSGDYTGGFISVIATDAAIDVREPNRIELEINQLRDRFTGTFELGWSFRDNPETVFVTTGTVSGRIVPRSTVLEGEFALDIPEASYLEYALGASGRFYGRIGDNRSIEGTLSSNQPSIQISFETIDFVAGKSVV